MEYRTASASTKAILAHLKAADRDFSVPLSQRVNLEEYATQLGEKAVTFEAWDGSTLAGLIACYMNDPGGRRGFISHVAVLGSHQGQGIAGRLVDECLRSASEKGLRRVDLEVNENNRAALGLYEKRGFRAIDNPDNALTLSIDLHETVS